MKKCVLLNITYEDMKQKMCELIMEDDKSLRKKAVECFGYFQN